MNPENTIADVAKARLLSGKGDPFLFADWERVVFLHFRVAPELVRRHVPAPLELDLHQDSACLSLAAVTMRNFRPCRIRSAGWIFRPIARQQFLNFRTYVRCGNEPGVLFLWGWLSQPLGIRLPSGLLGLPYTFANLDYDHRYESGLLEGRASAGPASGRLEYHASIQADVAFGPCRAGSLSEFAMERCTGFFSHHGGVRLFRAWHPPWVQAPLDATLKEVTLVTKKFPWFGQATLAGANVAMDINRVWLGRARRIPASAAPERAKRRVLSAFFEMP